MLKCAKKKKVHSRINELWYFDSIPEEKFRVAKPILSSVSQRTLPLLDTVLFKVSISPFHKNWGLPFVIHKEQRIYVPFVQHSHTVRKQFILVNDKLK